MVVAVGIEFDIIEWKATDSIFACADGSGDGSYLEGFRTDDEGGEARMISCCYRFAAAGLDMQVFESNFFGQAAVVVRFGAFRAFGSFFNIEGKGVEITYIFCLVLFGGCDVEGIVIFRSSRDVRYQADKGCNQGGQVFFHGIRGEEWV